MAKRNSRNSRMAKRARRARLSNWLKSIFKFLQAVQDWGPWQEKKCHQTNQRKRHKATTGKGMLQAKKIQMNSLLAD
jgi:hypothetical protein